MPLGIGLIFLVAACAKIMRPAATIHVTSMELVTANLPIVNSFSAFSGRASCSVFAGSAALAGSGAKAIVAANAAIKGSSNE